MLKKEEVFVRVSSENKARKLAKLLEMFGERVYEPTLERLKNGVVSDEYPVVHYNWEWNGKRTEPTDKTEVSLKELRNILSVEKLREGDVVVCKDDDGIAVGIFKEFDDFFGIYLSLPVFLDNPNNKPESGGLFFDNFIRYATEEEKALLEHKKELEVGRWYHCFNGRGFMVWNGGNKTYGFFDGKFEDEWTFCGKSVLSSTEATSQEVEEALIKEAKRRGFVDGAMCNNSNIHGSKFLNNRLVFNGQFDFDLEYNTLKAIIDSETIYRIFKDGKWAEVIKHEKSLEERVKELEEKVKQLENR